MKYYSEKLKTLFNSVEELNAAEVEFDNKQAAIIKAREERAARAKEVDEAYKKYLELRNAFVKDYGSYHYSITQTTDKPVDVFSIFNDLFLR